MKTLAVIAALAVSACAQDELTQLRTAAEQVFQSLGTGAAEPFWARIEESLPRLTPDSMEHAEAVGSLASRLIASGQDARGLRIFDEAMARMSHLPDRHPAMQRILDSKAHSLRSSQRHRQAADVFRRIVDALPFDDPIAGNKARLELANAYMGARMHEEALAVLQQLRGSPAGLDPEDISLDIATSLVDLGRFGEAELLIRRESDQARGPKSRAAWRYALARLYFQQGRLAEAEDLGFDGRPLRFIVCSSRDLRRELGLESLLDPHDRPLYAQALPQIIAQLEANLTRSSSAGGATRAYRIGGVASMISRLAEFEPRALGPLIESSAAALESAHLLGEPYRIDSMWADLIQAARRGGMASTAERLALRQIALNEKHRGKDSPSLDRTKQTLSAIRRGEPVR